MGNENPVIKIECQVCPNHCLLNPGQIGKCRARKNESGEIVSLNYGKLTTLALDPIEKKPLNCFMPGSKILSAGSFGCNLRCPFCQNYEISMAGEDDMQTFSYQPEELALKAANLLKQGNIGVAYTYNEPLVGFEYVRDTAKIVKSMGMKNVLVTNGTAELWVLEEFIPYIHAMNIDLKGFTQEYYDILGGNLKTVRDFIQRAAQTCHVELTTLIVPGKNDDPELMREEAAWIADIDPDIALHLSRFFPQYRMLNQEATSVARLMELVEVARTKLNYVFPGNC